MTTNLLASNITKYYQLFERLTEEAGNNVAYGNAERVYFAKWAVPSGTDERYRRVEPFYETECLDPGAGTFVKGVDNFDDNGKY